MMRAVALAMVVGMASAQPGPGPHPDLSPCMRECATHCAKTRPPAGTVQECDECVKKIPLGPKTDGNCTARQEMAFCEPHHPTPSPVASMCMEYLEKSCGMDRRDMKECDMCVEKAAKSAPATLNCTDRQEREFCEIRPAPSFECERELMQQCGAERGDQDKCDMCVKKNGGADNCTAREEMTFCNATHPPTPGPVSDKCEKSLAHKCAAARQQGQQQCDMCVKTVGTTEHCTVREELSFCNATKPVEDHCEEVLAESCADAKKQGAEVCDKCAEKVHAAKPDLACTRRDVIAYCGAAPQPGPIEDKCHMVLKQDCSPIPPLLCDKCAELNGAAANCTKREEMTYCGGDTPHPTPTPAECTKALKERCNKPGEDCASCAKKLGTEHGCTPDSEKAACQ